MVSTSRRKPCTWEKPALASNGWINRFKRRCHIVYRTPEFYQVRAGVLIQKLQKTGKITNYCKKN
jgi:hypothetical protein